MLQAAAAAHAALPGFIQLRDGYFVDSVTSNAFLPHGIAYQTWNRPLGVWQTPEQLRYDLDEMVKMGANAVRVDFVWQHIEEEGDNIFNWANYDLLVEECEKRDMRIFALIGYQWPPNWFPNEWYTMHPPETDAEGIVHTNRWQSDIIGYETPEARAQYAEWIATVCGRYKDSKAIAGWIVGNESGYLGLWSGLLDGYDSYCETAFRNYCQTKFGTIAAANGTWGTSYTNFTDIKFVDQYRAYGVEGAIWADMVQWREDSIASFTAVGAKAAKSADTNHLISYSTVGMQWGEEDWRYHAEDRGKITAYALATNAPIDFFSVNNYPWSILGHESQNGHWGISFTKKVAKVPVLYSETGFTSSETMWPGMNEERQGPLIRNSLWESLAVGAIGTHIFSWMDRPYITDREKGFGIVYVDRGIKPAYWVNRTAFGLMQQVKLADLLRGSQDPQPDIAFVWTDAVDSQYNRYECEMQQIAGALERLGFEPNFVNMDDLVSGAYTNYRVLILPRNMRVEDDVPGSGKTLLDFLRTEALPRGIHIVASADLPGMQNFNGKPRAAFVDEVRSLFGVDPSDVGGFETPMRRREYVTSFWGPIRIRFNSSAPGTLANYAYRPIVWKYNDEVAVSTGGVVWATMDVERNKGFENDTNLVGLGWGSYVTNGSIAVLENPGWQYSGTNVLAMQGDAVLWQHFPAVPFGRYTFSSYLRSSAADPLRSGSVASVAIEWYGESNRYLGVSEAAPLVTNTPGSGWVKYTVDAMAPSNTFAGLRVLRVQPTNLVVNPGLTGTNPAPAGWQDWGDADHDPETGSYLGTNGNSWAFWYDAGLYQDITSGFATGDVLRFGGRLYTPDWDALGNGGKHGVVELEFYNGEAFLSVTAASPRIEWWTEKNVWIDARAEAVVPANCTKVRILVRCNDNTNGNGRFYADDLYVRNASRGAGTAYADYPAESPAVVVKDHGTAKSAIFLYSVGDNSPDSGDDPDTEQDTRPWLNRFDVFGTLVKDYFGVQPRLGVSGTNAYLCLPEYRITSNNNVLIQLKNYMYDTNQANGGSPLTFTLTSALLTGKTVRAFEQGRILEEQSDGTVSVTLDPDGQEILHAYATGPATSPSTNQIVQFFDPPALVHPFGDKVYSIVVRYDCRDALGVSLYAAFMEKGDNGDGVTNEIYQILTNSVSGAGEQIFFMWIPDPDQTDPDYISTPDGGRYEFNTWLVSSSGVRLASAVPAPTILEWGIRPTNLLPTTLSPGSNVAMDLEWEGLYEQLAWQATPMTRNDAYPGRVAVYRSTKTESLYPGHFAKANAVCDWLESMGYVTGNDMDLGFDNVTVSGLFSNGFESGLATNWLRGAGAANWAVQQDGESDVDQGPGRMEKATIFNLYSAARRISYRITAEETKTLDRVLLFGSRIGTSPTYSLSVRSDAAGYPSSNVLVAATFSITNPAAGWFEVNLPDYAWTSGQVYHLVVEYASGSISTAHYGRIQYAGPEATGRRVLVSTAPGAWSLQAYQPTFRLAFTDNDSVAHPYASLSTLTVGGTRRQGQRFKPSETFSLTNIALLVRRQAADGDLLATVRRWSDKSVLAASVVARAGVATNNAWLSIPFPAGPTVSNGVQYYVEFSHLGTNGGYAVMRGDAPGGGAWSWNGTNDCTISSGNTGATYACYGQSDMALSIQGRTPASAYLRAWRIGNDDNYVVSGDTNWGPVTLSADIRYNRQGPYFNDAELFVKYVDRGNYTKVGIRNFYGFWRLRYLVRVNGAIQQQGWLHEFSKTNSPVEGAWYNLRVAQSGSLHSVYFDGQPVGSFQATNFPTGRIALGTRAVQLGIWDPQKGYYFIDDDENGQSGDPNVNGAPLNLDWGYLSQFYRTLVLPGVYAMNDTEASNMCTWVVRGLNGIISTDGGVAMVDESGAPDIGRVETVFGVDPSIGTVTGVTGLVIGTNSHYATLDYAPGASVAATGSGRPWTALGRGTALAMLQGTPAAPALVATVLTNVPDTPSKTFVFNFAADAQLEGSLATLAQRAFEWTRGQANKVQVELKYLSPSGDPDDDLTVYATNAWVLAGTGQTNLVLALPAGGLMTGDGKFYWAVYTYAWDATNAWLAHTGFYSSGNDNQPITIAGKGLQVFGVTESAYAGRDWDMWVGYNTRTTTLVVTYGVKDRGSLTDEDNFNDGNYTGWTVSSGSSVSFGVTNGALMSQTVFPSTQKMFITRSGLDVTGRNVSIEYDILFTNGAQEGGVVYRGVTLQVNPQRNGWDDTNAVYATTNRPAQNQWSHVVVHIRDGYPYLLSDLYVNGRPSFVSEPIEIASFSDTNRSIGFVAPSQSPIGSVRWDNVRVVDEQYSVTITNVFGEYVPTNNALPTFWPSVPDYDPDMWEHEGTSLGGAYDWYIHYRGEGIESRLSAAVYFSPRLQVESPTFPTYLYPGSNVVVPVEWENLPASNIPARLRLNLFEAFSGTLYIQRTVTVTAVTGSTNITATVPTAPAGSNYVWSAYMYATNAADPWNERFGSDDTYRFNEVGIGLEPETTIAVAAVVSTSGTYDVYSDAGIPAGASIFTWKDPLGSASWDSEYVDPTAPEGARSYYTFGSSWQGWGIFKAGTDLHLYSNGYLKFWVKSPVTVKVEIEGPQYTKGVQYIPSTTNVWMQKSISISTFGGVVLTNMFGLFEATTESSSTFYVDDVKWSLTP
jgi:hypothetical protein